MHVDHNPVETLANQFTDGSGSAKATASSMKLPAVRDEFGPFKFFADFGIISVLINVVDVFNDGQVCVMGPSLTDRPKPARTSKA